MYPIDKTNLDVLRFAHFLALAVITVRLVPQNWPGLPRHGCAPPSCAASIRWRYSVSASSCPLRPILPWSRFNEGIAMQVGASLLGIIVMIATAALISWYKRIEGRSPWIATWIPPRRHRRGRRGMRAFVVALICAACRCARPSPRKAQRMHNGRRRRWRRISACPMSPRRSPAKSSTSPSSAAPPRS